MTEDDLIREIRAKRADASSPMLAALRVFARALMAAFDGCVTADVVYLETRRTVVAGVGEEQADVWQVHVRGQGSTSVTFDRTQIGPRGARLEAPREGEWHHDCWGEWIADPDQLLAALADKLTPVGMRFMERLVHLDLRGPND